MGYVRRSRSARTISRKTALSMSDFIHTGVLVDPHPLWLHAVRLILRRTGLRVVATTTSPTHAVEIVELVQPDVLITELPNEEGELDTPTYLRLARERAPRLKTLVLSASTDPRQIDM